MSLKVAVIYGSRTCEHDVSIVSALQAMDNLDKNEYEIVPVYIARRRSGTPADCCAT